MSYLKSVAGVDQPPLSIQQEASFEEDRPCQMKTEFKEQPS